MGLIGEARFEYRCEGDVVVNKVYVWGYEGIVEVEVLWWGCVW